MTTAQTAREAWENEFREPDLDTLRGMYEDAPLFLFDSLHSAALGYEGVSAELVWEGIPWRWCLRFAHPADEGVFAYLVPDPEGPLLCLPLSTECVDSIPLHRLKRYARDAIVKADKVESNRWVTWKVSAKTELEELLDMFKRKVRWLSQRT